jgi:hypothetical protein
MPIKPVYDGFEDIIHADTQPAQIGKLTVSDVADEYHPLKSYFFAMANEMGLQSEAACQLDGEGIYPYFHHHPQRSALFIIASLFNASPRPPKFNHHDRFDGNAYRNRRMGGLSRCM